MATMPLPMEIFSSLYEVRVSYQFLNYLLISITGNGCVVIVLIASRGKMDVPRFLVCNLAMADFCMGLYLGFLAVIDAATLGEFRRFAIDWQFSAGCQVIFSNRV